MYNFGFWKKAAIDHWRFSNVSPNTAIDIFTDPVVRKGDENILNEYMIIIYTNYIIIIIIIIIIMGEAVV
jgi:hypothetical protein